MKNAASLYFTNTGYVICDPDGEPTSLMTTEPSNLSIEETLRRAWYYLGRGLADAISEGHEFLVLYSNTKVIDQLDGVIIDDEECIIMAQHIRTKGLCNLVYYELRKVTSRIIEKKFDEAVKALRG